MNDNRYSSYRDREQSSYYEKFYDYKDIDRENTSRTYSVTSNSRDTHYNNDNREKKDTKYYETSIKKETSKSTHGNVVDNNSKSEIVEKDSKKIKTEEKNSWSPVSPPRSPVNSKIVWSGQLAKGDIHLCNLKAESIGGPSFHQLL